jgi:hypothetical protein
LMRLLICIAQAALEAHHYPQADGGRKLLNL